MLDSFFENVGSKIKKYAQYGFAIETCISMLYGLFLFFDHGTIDEDTLPIFVCYFIAIPLAALILSWFVYGFGVLIESNEKTALNARYTYDETHQIKQNLDHLNRMVSSIANNIEEQSASHAESN
jgi:hypothetical protein